MIGLHSFIFHFIFICVFISVYSAPSSVNVGSSQNNISLTNVLTGKLDGTTETTSAVAANGGANILDYSTPGLTSLFMHISGVFILISSYYAMVSQFSLDS